MEKIGTGSFGKVRKVNRTFTEDDGVTISNSFYADKVYFNMLFKKNYFLKDVQ